MSRHYPTICILIYLLLGCFIYWPGTHGYFQFDDTINIVDSARIKISTLDFPTLREAALSGSAGVLGRPISVLSFALNYYFTQLDPFYFKLTNLFIHLLNGVCAYTLSRLLLMAHRRDTVAYSDTACRWVSVAVAAAWTLHPLNVSGVLYIVQRMTSLATLFMFLGLIAYVHGRLQQLNFRNGWPGIIAGFIVFTPLAAFSKENGALLPAFLLLAEISFFRFEAPSARSRSWLMALFFATVILPFCVVTIYTCFFPGWITRGYSVRDFSLVERCLTEARVVWFYIRLLIAPDVSQFGLYHDDFAVSKSLLDPVSTLFSIAALLILTVCALASLKRYRVAAFGILFFLLGHCLESTFIPLELVHEHRNYLPSFGLLFSMFYYLLYPLGHQQTLKLRVAAAVLFIPVFGALTYSRSVEWGNPVQLKEKEVERHPNSIRANIEIGYFYSKLPAKTQEEANEYYKKAYTYFATAAVISPADTLGLFGLIDLNLSKALPLEESWISALAKRIEANPFAPGTGNSIAQFKNCFIDKSCKVTSEMVETLIQAALRNPSLAGTARIQMLLAQAELLFDSRHQPDEAAAVALQAAEVNPNDIDTQIKVITFLINTNNLAEAASRIKKVRELDKLNVYTATLDKLQAWTKKDK